MIERVEREAEILHPFIIEDGNLVGGQHNVLLKSSKREYSLDFFVNDGPLLIERITTGLNPDGSIDLGLSAYWFSPDLEYVKASDGKRVYEKELDEKMPPDPTTIS